MLLSRLAGLGLTPLQQRLMTTATYTEALGATPARIENAYATVMNVLIARAQVTRDAFATQNLPACGFAFQAGCSNDEAYATVANIMDRGLASPFLRILWPLGVYMTPVGVPLTAEELRPAFTKNGSVTRTFTPTADQNALAAHLIYKASLASANDAISRLGGGGALQHVYNPSINQITQRNPQLVTGVSSFAFNPPPPTGDELTQTGGYTKWVNRGGWLIDSGIVAGKTALMRVALAYNTTYCKDAFCKTGVFASWPTAAVFNQGSARPALASFYLAADRAAWTMKFVYEEPCGLFGCWFDTFGTYAFKTLDVLHSTICAIAPILTSVDQAILSPDLCSNTKTKKPCKKGEKDCVCVAAPDTQKLAINAGNYIINYWCSKAVDPAAKPPVMPLPPPAAPSSFPWAWVIAGGAVLVAYKLSQK